MINRIATEIEKQECIHRIHHEADRSEYDTPGSVRGCPCDECNTVRKNYGERPIKRVFRTFLDTDFDDNAEQVILGQHTRITRR